MDRAADHKGGISFKPLTNVHEHTFNAELEEPELPRRLGIF